MGKCQNFGAHKFVIGSLGGTKILGPEGGGWRGQGGAGGNDRNDKQK